MSVVGAEGRGEKVVVVAADQHVGQREAQRGFGRAFDETLALQQRGIAANGIGAPGLVDAAQLSERGFGIRAVGRAACGTEDVAVGLTIRRDDFGEQEIGRASCRERVLCVV